MPIKDLSDTVRFPRAGKFHMGEKKISEKSGKEYPAATDYLVPPEHLIPILGEKPREIEIEFPINDRDRVGEQWYKKYGSGTGLVCKGDGEIASMVNTETGEFEEIECLGQECEHYNNKHCRRVMNLQFFLQADISGGVYQLDTGSVFSIIAFNSFWAYVEALNNGRVSGIPIIMSVVPREVSPGGKKKVVFILSFRLRDTLSLNDIRALAGSTPAPIAALPEPDCTTEPEHFYPPEVRPEGDTLPETNDPITDDLAAQMEPDRLDLDIIAMMDELNLTDAQRMIYRKKHPDREELLTWLVQQRDGKVVPLRPEAPSTPMEETQEPSPPADSPIAQAPASPPPAAKPAKKRYI